MILRPLRLLAVAGAGAAVWLAMSRSASDDRQPRLVARYVSIPAEAAPSSLAVAAASSAQATVTVVDLTRMKLELFEDGNYVFRVFDPELIDLRRGHWQLESGSILLTVRDVEVEPRFDFEPTLVERRRFLTGTVERWKMLGGLLTSDGCAGEWRDPNWPRVRLRRDDADATR